MISLKVGAASSPEVMAVRRTLPSDLFDSMNQAVFPHEMGLYIHVPFCRVRCHFCAFYVERYRKEMVESYLSALKKEITSYAQQCHRFRSSSMVLTSVYFGGGTPTTLTSCQMTDIVHTISESFVLSPQTEMTIEAHPHTVKSDLLNHLKMMGFNRVSLGVQSLDEEELAGLGGGIRPDQVAQAVDVARSAGFSNVNLDVMYGLPGQTPESWERTLLDIVRLGPEHISCYALTIEEGTRFAADQQRGTMEEIDDDAQSRMADLAKRILVEAGYAQYEIANFAKPGYACRHNMAYWSGGAYLGLGPSAQSFLAATRFGNVDNLSRYGEALRHDLLPLENYEGLDDTRLLREAMIFGLRMTEGVPLDLVSKAFAGGAEERSVSDLLKAGLLEQDHARLRLSALGQRFADSVALALW